MFERSIRSGLLLMSFLLSITSFSQGLGNSPYSRSGIGDLSAYRGTVRNMGMGGAGIAVMSRDYMNLLNPAALANLRGRYRDSLVKIDVGYTIQYKTLRDPQSSISTLGANINYIAFAFPANKTWTTSISLQPLTVVQNSYGYNDSVPNDPNHYLVRSQYKGSGGIYQLQWGNGFGIGRKLAIGLSTNFNFGTINQESTTQLIVDPNYPDTQNENGVNRKTSYSGLSLKPGFLFSKELFKITETVQVDSVTLSERNRLFYKDSSTYKRTSTGLFFNAAGTVEFFTSMKATETRTLFTRNSLNNVIYDSSLARTRAQAYFPTFYRAGISLERRGYWTVAADVMYTDWSTFSKNTLKNDTLKNSFSAYLGAEFIRMKDPSKPLKTMTYRGGLSYSSTPVLINGYAVQDYSASFGAAIPVGRVVRDPNNGNKPLTTIKPKLNIAVVVGHRSVATSEALRETYYRLQLSMVIYDKWFTRRRIQ